MVDMLGRDDHARGATQTDGALGPNTPGRRRTRPKHAPGPAPLSCGPCNPTGGADARGGRRGVGPRERSFRGPAREGASGGTGAALGGSGGEQQSFGLDGGDVGVMVPVSMFSAPR